MEELYCPYGEDSKLEVELVEDYDGKVNEIQILTQTWELDMGVEDDSWFNFSTLQGCGIDEYELEYVMSIKDSWEYLEEIIKEEE